VPATPSPARAAVRLGSPHAGELRTPSAYDDHGMLRFLLARLISVAVALVVASWIIDGLDITGGPIAVLGVAALFGIVTAVLGPILRLLSLPINVMTLGLFTFVVNGLLLMIVAGLSSHLQVGGILSTIVAALVISIVAGLSDLVLGRAFFRKEERRH
jgi:putative membrane protein